MRMRKSSTITMGFLLVLCLVATTTPRPAAARTGGDEKTLRLRAVAESSPIGRIISPGGVAVDGKLFTGERVLWGGEMVHVLSNQGASVSVDSLGEVRMKKGALFRLAANPTYTEELRGTIVASLISGEIRMQLTSEARAYVQACGSVFMATRGSTFRVAAHEGRALAVATVGSVTEQSQATQTRYVVRPIGMGANISVRARSTRQIQVQVTDENDRPVPDVPIIFALGSSGAGSLGTGAAAALTVTVRTNAQGVASTQYTAGPDPSSTTLTATVEGTRYSWIAQLSVTAAAAGFWTPLNTTLVVAGIAAGVATGVYIGTRSNDPLSQNGPPDIRPR